MGAHLYSARWKKVAWFIRRFGLAEVFKKPLRMAFAPLIISRLPKGEFTYQTRRLEYFYHRYNMTWASERCVEVPIALEAIARHRGEHILEVGNVLSHYQPVTHDLVDKYEPGPTGIAQDIAEYVPTEPYGLIISISTFEHIGFDDDAATSSADKILAALQNCRRMLQPSGELVVTVPIGYNPELDRMISRRELGAERETFLGRRTALEWRECSREEALVCQYRRPFPYANAIMVAEFGSVYPELTNATKTSTGHP